MRLGLLSSDPHDDSSLEATVLVLECYTRRRTFKPDVWPENRVFDQVLSFDQLLKMLPALRRDNATRAVIHTLLYFMTSVTFLTGVAISRVVK